MKHKPNDNCCQVSVTKYVVLTAYGFKGEQHGDDFGRRMIVDAGISMKNPLDAAVVRELGQDYVDMVQEYNP